MSAVDCPYAATLTPESVRAYVAEIAKRSDDPEVAHSMEDSLRAEVLTAIATSAVTGNDALLCALYAVQTDRIEFPRWCA